ncbi:MAG: hypothetical protein JWO06_3777 [Bacteroidota bacterium]|nr:hypothetical protein [Bacteroidota bacterium]
MREIYFNSNITPKAENEIKLLTLYYDKINIVSDAVYRPILKPGSPQVAVEDLQFIPTSFETDYKLLIDEKLISVITREAGRDDVYEEKFAKQISGIINASHDLVFPRAKDGRAITQEVYDILSTLRGFEWDSGAAPDTEFIWWYYAVKLKWFLKLLLEGKNCLTSSKNLSDLFLIFIKQSQEFSQELGPRGYSKSLALDAIKFSLPNPQSLSFENILELKFQLKDELALFAQTINSIEVRNKELLLSEMDTKEYEKIFFDEIQKPLSELEVKIQNLKSSTFRDFIDQLKNPLSYAPLIGTVVASMPIEYTLVASMGLTSCSSYLKYWEERNEIRNNGLYFLLKLK